MARVATLKRAVVKVGDFALRHFDDLGNIAFEQKGPGDYVSQVDREAEALARLVIRSEYPDAVLFGEEAGGETGEAFWIIDPIDGTSNYLSGLPVWAVSIAYIEKGEPIAGAVSLPALGTLITGGRGLPLAVAGLLRERQSGRPVSFCVGRNIRWPDASRHALEVALANEGLSVVTTGSCAASLALVAAGRLEGFVERSVKLWDCAAGYALCRAAGVVAELRMNGSPTNVDVIAVHKSSRALDLVRSHLGWTGISADGHADPASTRRRAVSEILSPAMKPWGTRQPGANHGHSLGKP